MHAVILMLMLPLLLQSGAVGPPADRGQAGSQQPDAVILWGPDYSFSITAEADWVVDETIDHSSGKRAAIYPRGIDPRDQGALVAYVFVKTISRTDYPGTDLSSYIEQQWAAFKGGAPSATRIPGESILTRTGKAAVVSHVHPGPAGPVTVHAYIEEPKAFILIVLVGQTQKDAQNSFAVFKHLVESYVPMSIPKAKE